MLPLWQIAVLTTGRVSICARGMYSGGMNFCFRLVRMFALMVAVLAYAVNGAQARIVASADGELVVPICSVDGTRYLTIDLGDDAPVESNQVHCGGCLILHPITPDVPALPRAAIQINIARKRLFVRSVPVRAPIWPGAPPIGPPLS